MDAAQGTMAPALRDSALAELRVRARGMVGHVRHNPKLLLGLVLLVLLLALGVFGPLLIDTEEARPMSVAPDQSPSRAFPFGTESQGRDMLALVVRGIPLTIEIGLIAMLRALAVLTGSALSWGLILLGFGVVNILYGNLLALRQTLVKRLLAYSSLSHMGYILMGLGIALYGGVTLGAQGAFFHLFNHMLMKGLAFLSVGALMYGCFLQNDSHASLKVADLAGAAQKRDG